MSTTTYVDNVAQAQALIAETRTWANSIKDLSAPTDLFKNEIDTIGNTLDTNAHLMAS